MVSEADQCSKPGEIGALMRREGIYSSMLANWRKQQAQAERAALVAPKRGPKPATNLAEQRQLKQLTSEVARLGAALDRAHIELAPRIGVTAACVALRINRASVYRERSSGHVRVARLAVRPRPPLSLSVAEQQLLLGLLDSERFADVAPASIFATLLDEGRYHGSIRTTMYRLLRIHHQLRERCRQRVHPLYTKPELLAMRPNEVWSWDISVPQPSGVGDERCS